MHCVSNTQKIKERKYNLIFLLSVAGIWPFALRTEGLLRIHCIPASIVCLGELWTWDEIMWCAFIYVSEFDMRLKLGSLKFYSVFRKHSSFLATYIRKKSTWNARKSVLEHFKTYFPEHFKLTIRQVIKVCPARKNSPIDSLCFPAKLEDSKQWYAKQFLNHGFLFSESLEAVAHSNSKVHSPLFKKKKKISRVLCLKWKLFGH